MEAGLGGGSDLSEARRVGRGSDRARPSRGVPFYLRRAATELAYSRRAGPSLDAPRGPWPSDRAGTVDPCAVAHMRAVPFHAGFF